MSNNLEPGQYQIGDFVFGSGTLFNVEDFDIGGYEVNNQDFQVTASDEIRFGKDSFKPLPIQLIINARENRLLTNVASLVNETRDLHFENDRTAGRFVREWRSDPVREKWGELKPLLFCRDDGKVVRIYGRPGKTAVSRKRINGLERKIVAEFRRSDTLCYSDFEWFAHTRPGEIVNILRAIDLDQGDAPSWLRFVLIGPMIHPIIQLGTLTIELDEELNTGDIVEISSYPWGRRVVRLNDGANLSAKLISPYLDKLKFDADSVYELSWTATGTNGESESVDFSTYPEDPDGLPTDTWEISYYGPGAGTLGVQTILGHKRLAWDEADNDERVGVARFKATQTVSDYQLAGYKVETPPEATLLFEEAGNRIIGRCNSTATEYAYWEITYWHFWYGVHKNGQDYRLSEKFRIPKILVVIRDIISDLFELIFQGTIENLGIDWDYSAEFGTGQGINSSRLRINEHTVGSFNDISGMTPSGPSHRFTGIGLHAPARIFTQSTPGTISEFWMRDNAPPDIAETLNTSTVFMLWRDAWHVI